MSDDGLATESTPPGVDVSAVEWVSEHTFRIGGVRFHTSLFGGPDSSAGHFRLVKPRVMVERYTEMFGPLRPTRIVELGIYEGGSTAFLSLLGQPERLVAVDIKDEPASALEEFVDTNGLGDRVHTHYSFDQGDVERLRELLASEFGGRPLDLVIDDASHRLGPTRTSFNALFPHLRPGGIYVIEDWSGLHHMDAALRTRAESDDLVRDTLVEHILAGRVPETPLSVLLFEFVLASAYAPSVIAEMVVCDGWAHVVRGTADVDASTFDVSCTYSSTAGSLITSTG